MKMFNNEFFTRLIIDFILLGLLSTLLGGWLNFRFNKKLKEYEPYTAAEVLKKENFLNAKKDAYYEAIKLVNRVYACLEWVGPGITEEFSSERKSGTSYPTELECNMVYNKLCIYANSKDIPNKFKAFFDPEQNRNAPLLCEFINILKRDLGYADWFMECEDDFIRIFIKKDAG